MMPQMMPGMAPPPPGAYMPGPYMQPMPYPMPPPNGKGPLCFSVGGALMYLFFSSDVPIDADGPDAAYVSVAV